MLGVEEQQTEVLDRQGAELRHQELRGIDGGENLGTLAPGPHQRAPPGLDRRQKLRGPRAADPWNPPQFVGGRPRESMEPADGREDGVGEFERAGPRIAVTQDDREEFVVTEPGRADALELLTRAVMRRHRLHRRPLGPAGVYVLLYFPVVRRLLVISLFVLAIAGCSGPPQKEIDQAQSALDAARAAGAERYASAEYAAASSSLQKAHAAVDQRDYRSALNYAIDSRQRAVEAEQHAADGKARAKTTTEALYGEVATRANQLQAALRAAEKTATAKALRPAQASLRDARALLQKASASISAGNYDAATKTLTEVRGKIDAALVAVQNIPPRPARRRR